MDLVIAGAGRAGGSLAIALGETEHELVGVLSRSATDLSPVVAWDEELPACHLLVLAVTDAAIALVAERLAPFCSRVGAAVHLSGFTRVDALASIAHRGVATGSFHPLQTLPDPIRGAAALAGSWAAITAPAGLTGRLESLAADLGMSPFDLADDAKPFYHAAATAASNYVVAALGLAEDLFGAAGVPMAAAGPLTGRVVANVFEGGAGVSLTGPIARGDHATVAGQQSAADAVSESVGRQFHAMAEATAERVRDRP